MTRAYWVSTLSRVFCGIVFIVHGTPKILNLEGTRMFFENVGIPGALAIPVALLEFVGGTFLLAGLATRIVAGLFVVEMIAAAFLVNLQRGWDVFGGGFEYNIALIILLLAVVLLGAGPLSVDDVIAAKPERKVPTAAGRARVE